MNDKANIASLGTLSSTSRAVVRELLTSGPLPRATLARRLGLSPARLTKVTRPLLDSAVIYEDATAPNKTPGRPGTPLAVHAPRYAFAGFKITGDTLYGTRVDAEGRVQRAKSITLESTDSSHVVDLIIDLVKELGEEQPLQAIGIGSAGTMRRYDDRVRRNQYLGWDDVPLAEILTAKTGLPTVISGDIRALTVGVQWSGPGQGHSDFAVVTIGVGIGLGMVIDDQVHAGTHGTAGMIGHTRVSEAGPLCELGHRGCASAYLNADSILAAISVPHGITDLDLDGACRLADRGDPVAQRVLSDAGRALGVLIAQVVNVLGLDTVILAGDGLVILEHLSQELNSALRDHLDPWGTVPHLETFHSDFDEWARGAAVLSCQWLLVDPPKLLAPSITHQQ